MYLVGIDLGGTFIKGGICSLNGEILIKNSLPTQVDKGQDKIVENICQLIKDMVKSINVSLTQIKGIGVGVPGMIDSEVGEVVFAGNLNLKNFNLKRAIEDKLKVEVKIANDANVAALGEARFGASSSYDTSVLVTLGTGVGGGIIIDKNIYAGNRSAGAEIGHMIIQVNGKECSCGLRGCYERYASATGLIEIAKEFMLKDKNSKLWEYGLEGVNGQNIFDCCEIDLSAKKAVEKYVDYVSVGLVNIANVFRPQAILLGGGISNAGDKLLLPLKAKLKEMIFAGNNGPNVELKIASLKNDAGIYGACALIM